ncbi:hypothetical protein ACFVZ3_26375 [Kitasatospora purpeofusca]|uniref:hypothetical protein n=1 Tax=Kitasatospora purpeofusca TaxID=67352 RepID=UPI003687B1D8
MCRFLRRIPPLHDHSAWQSFALPDAGSGEHPCFFGSLWVLITVNLALSTTVVVQQLTTP